MSPEAAQLRFAVEFATFLVAVAGATIVLLRPQLVGATRRSRVVLTLGFIGTFQVFDQIFVMTSGGPAKSTITLGYLIYMEGFGNFSMGYASAIAIVLFAMIMTIFLIQRRIVGGTER